MTSNNETQKYIACAIKLDGQRVNIRLKCSNKYPTNEWVDTNETGWQMELLYILDQSDSHPIICLCKGQGEVYQELLETLSVSQCEVWIVPTQEDLSTLLCMAEGAYYGNNSIDGKRMIKTHRPARNPKVNEDEFTANHLANLRHQIETVKKAASVVIMHADDERNSEWQQHLTARVNDLAAELDRIVQHYIDTENEAPNVDVQQRMSAERMRRNDTLSKLYLDSLNQP
jgi:hypothetical protein